jgi:hypothetical protein
VDGSNGSDQNNCRSPQTACSTIQHAISLASTGDSIRVASAIYRENLLSVNGLTIVGAGAQTTIIDGQGLNRVMSTAGRVFLVGLTIRDGHTRFLGGGIYNSGILSLNNCIVSGNQAGVQGGGILNAQTGTITITNSTISDNTASSSGGAIFNYGYSTINNSTVSGNSATDGGGIYGSGGAVTITNSTITHNTASQGGGGIGSYAVNVTINNSTVSANRAVYVGGIYTGGVIQNSIVANNSGGNCSGPHNYPITSHGYNLSSDDTCLFNQPGDLNNTDPLLGLLQYNGGPTQTMALDSGSPAIDAGNPNGCTDGSGHLLTTDQRGYPRPDQEDTGGCDMGAYERQTD